MLLHDFPAVPFECYGITVAVHSELEVFQRLFIAFIHQQGFANADISDIIVGIQLQNFLPHRDSPGILAIIVIPYRLINACAKPGWLEDDYVSFAAVKYKLVPAREFYGCRYF